MNKKFGYFAFCGLLLGALFGSALGSANGNPILGLGYGALTGVFVGWFVYVAATQQSSNKK